MIGVFFKIIGFGILGFEITWMIKKAPEIPGLSLYRSVN